MNIDDYKERVQKLAKLRDGEPIYNGSLDHAAVIIENMFAHAKQSVLILTGALNARVYGPNEVLEQAGLFLADPRHYARILVEEPEALGPDHPFIQKFAENKNVHFRYLEKEHAKLFDFHFVVMDGDSYRFEESKDHPAAIAAFGDVTGAENLKSLYEVLWGYGSDCQLQQKVVA